MQDSTVCDGEWWFEGIEELDNLINDLTAVRVEVSESDTKEDAQ